MQQYPICLQYDLRNTVPMPFASNPCEAPYEIFVAITSSKSGIDLRGNCIANVLHHMKLMH